MKISFAYCRFSIERFFNRIFSTVFYIIKRLLGLVEVLLLLRFILKFFAANPNTLIVDLIYKYSSYLVSPFDFIFNNIYFQGYLIEMDTISAMVGYGIVIIILFWVLKLLLRED
ncbi:MAG: hypothetical protein ABH889_03175 [Candidatus Portnoybacteria bacterium]